MSLNLQRFKCGLDLVRIPAVNVAAWRADPSAGPAWIVRICMFTRADSGALQVLQLARVKISPRLNRARRKGRG